VSKISRFRLLSDTQHDDGSVSAGFDCNIDLRQWLDSADELEESKKMFLKAIEFAKYLELNAPAFFLKGLSSWMRQEAVENRN